MRRWAANPINPIGHGKRSTVSYAGMKSPIFWGSPVQRARDGETFPLADRENSLPDEPG